MKQTDLADKLATVYGDHSPPQMDRYQRAIAAFVARYGPGPIDVFRAPGRVNLIGEHTDYNQGFVLPMALDKDILLLARSRTDDLLRLSNVEEIYPPTSFRVSREIPPAPVGHWSNYVRGATQQLAQESGQALHGFDGLVSGSPPYGVPRGAGLSSSSALTVVGAVTLAGINDLGLSRPELADICGRAEWYVGTRGGIMDQFASLLGQRGQALFLDCRPQGKVGSYHHRQIPLPADYRVVIVDSGVAHENTGPFFNQRVAACRIGAALLGRVYPDVEYLRDVQDRPWPELADHLPETIDREELASQGIDLSRLLDGGRLPEAERFYVRRRCRHVISENRRVLQSVQALQKGDMPAFGRLLREAYRSAREDYEITTAEIDSLVEIASALPGVLAARLTGAGWGGSVVCLVREGRVDDVESLIVRRYYEATGLTASAFGCHAGPGAGFVARV